MTTIANKIGFIYKIVCLDPSITDCYVGSCQSFRTRKANHKSACSNSNSNRYNLNVYNFIRANGGWSNWSMLAIEQVEYTIKHELLVRERFHLEQLKATLNKVIPSRTQQELSKQYREENKTELNEKAKKYYEEHKTEAKQYQKEHYEANKTQILEKQKAYYESKKEQISEQKKQIITCACGSTSTKSNISQHNKSRRHQNYLVNLPQEVPSEVASTVETIS
jgi:hypothetical protein